MLYPVFTRVWLSRVVGFGLLDHPVMFADDGTQVHVKSVPVTLEVRVTPVAKLLHCAFDAGMFERFGVGKIVTV
jgi:hypothetical protein